MNPFTFLGTIVTEDETRTRAGRGSKTLGILFSSIKKIFQIIKDKFDEIKTEILKKVVSVMLANGSEEWITKKNLHIN